jgi:hypothetical protein
MKWAEKLALTMVLLPEFLTVGLLGEQLGVTMAVKLVILLEKSLVELKVGVLVAAPVVQKDN